MKRGDLGELLLLAAIWGGSFLFIRIGVGEFGPLPLTWGRVAGGAVVLLPALWARREGAALARHWKPIFIVGIVNSALPFTLFAYAGQSIGAGLSSVFNAASPLFGGAIAWLWLSDRLSRPRLIGLAVGFIGVFGLALAKSGVAASGDPSTAMATLACIGATVCYGFSANFAKRYLAGVAPMAVASGSLVSASLVLTIPAWWSWPAAQPGMTSWLALVGLALVCTGLAYVIYYRLITSIGAANTIAVTFLIPAFAVAWGAMLLGETLTWAMTIGCAVILVGTALATGLLPRRTRVASGPDG